MRLEHPQLNQHEFEQSLGNSEQQPSLVCCSTWGSQRLRHDCATEQQQQIASHDPVLSVVTSPFSFLILLT